VFTVCLDFGVLYAVVPNSFCCWLWVVLNDFSNLILLATPMGNLASASALGEKINGRLDRFLVYSKFVCETLSGRLLSESRAFNVGICGAGKSREFFDCKVIVVALFIKPRGLCDGEELKKLATLRLAVID